MWEPSARSSVCTAKHSPKETKPMALPQSAVSDLLEVLRTGEAVDLIRESVRTVLQELIEAEAAVSVPPLRAVGPQQAQRFSATDAA
jgi:putative transposase